jgi:hypothetical protein
MDLSDAARPFTSNCSDNDVQRQAAARRHNAARNETKATILRLIFLLTLNRLGDRPQRLNDFKGRGIASTIVDVFFVINA